MRCFQRHTSSHTHTLNKSPALTAHPHLYPSTDAFAFIAILLLPSLLSRAAASTASCTASTCKRAMAAFASRKVDLKVSRRLPCPEAAPAAPLLNCPRSELDHPLRILSLFYDRASKTEPLTLGTPSPSSSLASRARALARACAAPSAATSSASSTPFSCWTNLTYPRALAFPTTR